MAYNSLVISPRQKKSVNLIEPPQITSTSKTPNRLETPVDTNGDAELTESDKSLKIGNFVIAFGSHSGIIKDIYSERLEYSSILTNFLYLFPQQVLKTYSSTVSEAKFVYQYRESSWEQTLEAVDNVKLRVKIRLISKPSLDQGLNFNLFDVDAKKVITSATLMRESMLFELSHLVGKRVIRRGHAFKFTSKDNIKNSQPVEWFALRDRYHFNLVRPLFKCPAFSTSLINEHALNVSVNECALDSGVYEFEMYIGPQDLELLNSYGGDINQVMAFSGNAILNFIEKGIYKFLLLINKVTHNWGLSIILISLIIYGVTYPLTFKSMLSMKKMQQLQPKMAALKEKYKDDPQKLNMEVIQLYKENNVNPLSGCLPTLLQMPVFISLYQVLWRTHNFQHANFLWIKDLSMPDRAFILNMNLPFIGNEINVLPIIMAIVMFFQQRFSSKSMVVSDPSQEMQQKMMLWIFPVFIGGIFYHFASGLTLYFTVFYLMSTLMQYKMSKLR